MKTGQIPESGSMGDGDFFIVEPSTKTGGPLLVKKSDAGLFNYGDPVGGGNPYDLLSIDASGNLTSVPYIKTTTLAALGAAIIAQTVAPGQKYFITDSTCGTDYGVIVSTVLNPYTGLVEVCQKAQAINLMPDYANTGNNVSLDPNYADVINITGFGVAFQQGMWDTTKDAAASNSDMFIWDGNSYQVTDRKSVV